MDITTPPKKKITNLNQVRNSEWTVFGSEIAIVGWGVLVTCANPEVAQYIAKLHNDAPKPGKPRKGRGK